MRKRSGSPSIPARSATDASLQIYFSVAHDPTQLNARARISARNIVRPSSRRARINRASQAYIAQLNEARAFRAAIVTKLEPDRRFYPAEDYIRIF